MQIKNFKGVSDKEIRFDGSTKIQGCNGAGKTTISDCFYWVFADINTALTKNPNITPIGMPECISRVDIDLEIDGKPVSIAKSQKFKTKEIDGKVTSSVTNSYEINSVEKSARDFLKDLDERGIDMENFLLFSHPAFFTVDNSKKGRDSMREMLFQMCANISDEQIAAEMSNIDELKNLLSTYKIDEIEQMNKATIKRITETVGTNNALINARIDELYSQKKEVDMAVLEEQKKNYESEIERIDKELMNISGNKADLVEKLSSLRIKKEQITTEANLNLNNERSELQKQIHEMETIKSDYEFKISKLKNDIENQQRILEEAKSDVENQRNLYKAEQDLTIDENELSCPVCKREYPAEKVNEIKADFERNKEERLKTIESTGKALKEKINAIEAHIDKASANKTYLDKLSAEHCAILDDAKTKLAEIPSSVDLGKNDEYIKITSSISELETELAKSDDSRKSELESQKSIARQMLNNVISSMGASEINADIDKRIEELKDRRRTAEIEKANAEKIISQVVEFRFYKNDKLSESINSHFKIAQFRLFKTLKNGTTEDACDVLIDGKEITTQANQSLQVLAKLDIINGLSKYFEKVYPVFVDDASLLTENTLTRVDMDNQLIWLRAVDGYRELVIENA